MNAVILTYILIHYSRQPLLMQQIILFRIFKIRCPVYNVYINANETLLTYWETHTDSAAMLFHEERFYNGGFIGQVVERIQSTRLYHYGDVSDGQHQNNTTEYSG